jgi:ATP-dependent helicase HrpB
MAQDTIIAPLFGSMSKAEQDAAIQPTSGTMRKIVLSTSIAETSITIDGVRVVIDSGLQRLPVFEPSTGITRLETVRVSRASADQRAGRAGRTQAGIAIRLWHSGQTASLPAFTAPQIFTSDLSGLVLDLAHWGVTDPNKLVFVDPPPSASITEARQLLHMLGALDGNGHLTERGHRMRSLALPPRLAAMVLAGADIGQACDAALLAVLMTEQGLGGTSVDLEDRLRRFKSDRTSKADASRKLAGRMIQTLPKGPLHEGPVQPGLLLIAAFPDRIALQRGERGRYLMANGRGAELDAGDRLAGAKMLVIADLTGQAGRSRILSAAEISRADVEDQLPGSVLSEDQCLFDKASKQVRARKVTRLGAIVFDETPLSRPIGEKAARALADGLRELGLEALTWSSETQQLRDRISFLHKLIGEPWPDVSDVALMTRLEDWFIPFQGQTRGLADLSQTSLHDGLMALVPHEIQRDLARLAPKHFEAPTGQRHPIRYDGEEPVLSIRVQELFGLRQHPVIGGGKLPLLLELTSPAHRLIQTTRDLPGFWAGSWKAVRAEMRGRYPRHPWPEEPHLAMPTTRAKPRGT